MNKDEPCLAVKGLVGWHVEGRQGPSTTYSVGPYYKDDDPRVLACPYVVDMSEVYAGTDLGTAAVRIWKRPTLALGLPDNNVRSLFEGCIGCEGFTSGHPWDGALDSLQSADSVGLIVYLEVLKAAGGRVIKEP